MLQFANILNNKILKENYNIALTSEELLTIKKYLIITTLREIDVMLEVLAKEYDPSKKYYQYANQKNVLYSLAALFSLEMYAYRAIAIKNNDEIFVPVIKTMFSIINSHWKDVSIGNGAIVIGENMYMI